MPQVSQTQYFLLILFGLFEVYLLVLTGLLLTFRPGFPTISRMIVDHPSIAPMQVAFAFTLHALRSWVTKSEAKFFGELFGWLQVLSLILIAVLPLDYQFISHMVFTSTIVGATVMRELIYANYLFGRSVDYYIEKLHIAYLVFIIFLSICFMTTTMAAPTLRIPFNLMEYVIFASVAGILVFPIREV